MVDLDRVLADDRLIDEIAHLRRLSEGATGPAGSTGPANSTGWPTGPGRPAGAHRPSGRCRCGRTEPLIDLLDEWRAELSTRPLPATLVLPTPVPSVRATPRSRSLRPTIAVAAAIGAVVIGSATIAAAEADPNSLLWPVTQALWPDRAASFESAGTVRSALADARAALNAGRPGDAKDALRRASDALAQVPAGEERDGMWQQVVALSVSAVPSARMSVGQSPDPAGVVEAAESAGAGAVQPAGASAVATAPVEAAAGDGHHLPALARRVESSSPAPTVPSPTSNAGATSADGSSAGPVSSGGPAGAVASSGADSAGPPSTAATPTPPPVTPTPTAAATDPSEATASSSPAATQQSAPSPTATPSAPPSAPPSSQSPAVAPYDLDSAESDSAAADAATDGSGTIDSTTAGSAG